MGSAALDDVTSPKKPFFVPSYLHVSRKLRVGQVSSVAHRRAVIVT